MQGLMKNLQSKTNYDIMNVDRKLVKLEEICTSKFRHIDETKADMVALTYFQEHVRDNYVSTRKMKVLEDGFGQYQIDEAKEKLALEQKLQYVRDRITQLESIIPGELEKQRLRIDEQEKNLHEIGGRLDLSDAKIEDNLKVIKSWEATQRELTEKTCTR